MPLLAAIALLMVLIASTSTHARRDSEMPDDPAAELRRLQRNQAVLLAAVNRLIAETGPIALANPADFSSGYVTKGLILDAEGLIVPGTIPAQAPQTTLRGVRAGDPLWTETPGSP
jgi:hypothetical protein